MTLQEHARRVIGIDVDGVLLDIVMPWLFQYELVSGHVLENDDIRSWDLSNWIRSDWNPRFYDLRTPDLYSIALPVAGSVLAVEELARQGHTLVAITHDGPEFVAAKRARLARYFPAIQHIVFAKDKECVRVDVLIDDAPHNVNRAHGAILLDAPWNRNAHIAPHVLRVADWSDIPHRFGSC
jgi:5'(3')-deoxyribonucleotidase